jgi:hypothetical protein
MKNRNKQKLYVETLVVEENARVAMVVTAKPVADESRD